MNGRLRRALLAIATIALVGTAVAGGALAAGGVKTYTACLTTNGGTLILVKEGSSPQKPCPSGSVQIRFSEGDITAVTAGTGLSGGGTSGEVALSIATGFRLPQGCATGKIAKWDGDSWECADDSNTTYEEGTGIDITGTSIAIAPSYRLPEANAGDSIVKGSGTTWTTEQFTRAGEGCTTGQFVTGTTSSGGVSCGAPAASATGGAYYAIGDSVELGGTMDAVTLDLPAGSYLLFANVRIIQRDSDTASSARCNLGNGQFTIRADEGENGLFGGAGTGAVNHAGGPISLKCTETSANVDIVDSQFYALRVASFNAP